MLFFALVSGCSVVDGSGAVTGLAYHQLQQEYTVMATETDKHKAKAMAASKKLDQERCPF